MITTPTPTQPPPTEPGSALSALRQKSLQTSGYAYLVGDAALFASGLMSGRSKEASSGLLYAAAGGILARYGDKDSKHGFDILQKNLSAYLEKEGVALPEHGIISRDTLTNEGGLLDKVEDFLHAHPAQAANAIFAGAGVQLFRSGVAHQKKWDKYAGGAVVAGALAGLLIPESTEKLPRTGNIITDSWHAIREKPLQVTGGLYMLNNAALIVSGLKERRANPANKSYVFKLLTAASYIVANSLIAISSKGKEADADQENMQRLYASSAEIIAAQPPEIRHMVTENVARFLAAQPDVALTSREANQALSQHIDQLACQQSIAGKGEPSWKSRIAESGEAQGPSRV